MTVRLNPLALLLISSFILACEAESAPNGPAEDELGPMPTTDADDAADDVADDVVDDVADGVADGEAQEPDFTLDVVKSGLGESCLVTDHCDTDLGLICVGNTCVNPENADPGDAGAPVAPQRLGQAGESCRARVDCDLGLACIGNTCVVNTNLNSEQDDAGAPPPPLGQEGESCTSRSDCTSGLACVLGSCVRGSTGLEPTGKQCVVIECEEAIDCCPEPTATCTSLEATCQATPTSTACDQFEQQCVCDGTSYDCTNNQCVFVQCREPVDCCPTTPQATCDALLAACDLDPLSLSCTDYETFCQCDGSGYKCNATNSCETLFSCDATLLCPTSMICDEAAGVCVGCLADSDCTGEATCVEQACVVAGCQRNEECPFFNECQDGECVEVGCKTDRECKAFTSDLRAVCDAGECRTPCSSDFECAPVAGMTMICVDNTCVEAGCETNEECRLQLNIAPTTSSFEIRCQAVP